MAKRTSTSVGSYVARLWSEPIKGYSDEGQAHKSEAHKCGKDILKMFAEDYLGLSDKQFDVRSNQGGVAVSGEVTLHTDHLPGCNAGIYVQFCQSHKTVLYRTVSSRKDYTGGVNQWADIRDILHNDETLKTFASIIKRLCGDSLLKD